jgi:hypothetical protein
MSTSGGEAMAYERKEHLRRFAMDRLRTDAVDAEASKRAQLTPGRSTLTELLDPVEVAYVFDTQLELAARQLVALETANHAGDHRGSAVAASGLCTALTLAGTAVIRARAQSEDHAAALSRRLTSACEVTRPVLEQAVNYTYIDSILGETTLDGILRVLDIPRHMVFPASDHQRAPEGSDAPRTD